MNNNIAYVIAHPDDELIVFGNSLMNSITKFGADSIHVICTSYPDDSRAMEFTRLHEKLGTVATICNLKDDHENSVFSDDMVDKLTRYFLINNISHIFTHCLKTGDLGNHINHKTTAMMAKLAAVNVSRIHNKQILVYHRYQEGYVKEVNTCVSSLESYTKLIELIQEFYSDQLLSLNAPEYPIRCTELYYTVSDYIFESHIFPAFMAHELKKWEEATRINEDVFLTKTSIYETKKRKIVIDNISEYIKEIINPVVVIDIGPGVGETSREFKALLVKSDVDIEKYITLDFTEALSFSDRHFKSFDDMFEFLDALDSDFTDFLLVGFQSLYYIDEEILDRVMKYADYIIAEGYIIEDDDPMTCLLKDNFEYKEKQINIVTVDNTYVSTDISTSLHTLAVGDVNLIFGKRRI